MAPPLSISKTAPPLSFSKTGKQQNKKRDHKVNENHQTMHQSKLIAHFWVIDVCSEMPMEVSIIWKNMGRHSCAPAIAVGIAAHQHPCHHMGAAKKLHGDFGWFRRQQTQNGGWGFSVVGPSKGNESGGGAPYAGGADGVDG